MTTPTAEESRALLEPLTGYTQAPWEWRIEENDPEWGRTYSLAPGILLPDGSDGTPEGDDKDRANARLIAAAPDIADHLRAALDREAELQVEIDAAVEWAEKAEAERDAARAEVERLRTALAVYADPMNWEMNGPLDANGARFTGGPAREALAMCSGGGEP